MRCATFLVGGLALLGAGCDVFLPARGNEGQPCLDNRACRGDLVCNQDDLCVACADDCGPAGATRCLGAVVQRCQSNGACLRWSDHEDCAASSQACVVVAGAAQCGACTSNCPNLNDLRCNGDRLEICEDAGAECLLWRLQTDCASSGQTCDDSGTPRCVSGCTDECTDLAYPACNGDLLEDCVMQADGCLDLVQEDCSLPGAGWTCDPTVFSCAQLCASDCLESDDDRCGEGLVVSSCLPVDGFPGCLQWQPVPCVVDGDCDPCETGSFDTVCETTTSSCACTIPCGTDGLTCCPARHICSPADHTCQSCTPPLEPCGTVCCDPSSDEFCVSPGVCDVCPGPSCQLPTEEYVCCRPFEVCAGEGCCDPGCEGLPCGPAPANACGVTECPASQGLPCALVPRSLTLGGALDEVGLSSTPSVVEVAGAPWALTWSDTRSAILLARFLEDGSLAKAVLVGAGGAGAEGGLRYAKESNTLFIAGTTAAWQGGAGNGGQNAWITQLGADATSVVWSRVYGTAADDQARDLQPLPGQALVVVGSSRGASAPRQGLVLLLDTAGTLSVVRLLGQVDMSRDVDLTAVAPLVDSASATGIVAVGTITDPPDSAFMNPFVIRLAPDLASVAWQIELEDGSSGMAHGVVADDSGGVFVVGQSRNVLDTDMSDVWAVKLDAATGAIRWQRTYRIAGTSEYCLSVAQAADGTLLLAGSIYRLPGQGGSEGWLLGISAEDGHLLWQRQYGGPGNDFLTMAMPRALGGFLAAGFREVTDHDTDLWLLMTDEAGWIPTCAGSTEAAYTEATSEDAGFHTVVADTQLVDPAGSFGWDDVTSNVSIAQEKDLPPSMDCPCPGASSLDPSATSLNLDVAVSLGGYRFLFLGQSGGGVLLDVSCASTGASIAASWYIADETGATVYDAGVNLIEVLNTTNTPNSLDATITITVP